MDNPHKRTVVWFDVDGVLLDYTSAFLDFAELHHLKPDDLKSYDLTLLFNTPEECYDCMKRFGESYHFSQLRTMAGPKALAELKNMGYEIRVLTQVGGSENSRRMRVSNLTEAFGYVFDGIHFTNRNINKLDYVSAKVMQDPNVDHILVEDNPALLLESIKLNKVIRTIAIRHSYNANVLDGLQIEKFDMTSGAIYKLIQERLGYVE